MSLDLSFFWKRFMLVIGLSVLLIFLFTTSTRAQLTVNPLTIELEAAPGESASDNFTLRNTGEKSLKVNIQLVDWGRTPGGDLQFLPPGANDRSCSDWLLYSPTSITLAPGDERQVSVEVEVPKEAKGDHWAMLLVTEQAEEIEDEEPVSARFTVNYAIKILQRDPKQGVKNAKISNIELTGTNQLQFSISFLNSGTSHLMTTGTVEIRNLQGETIREFKIEEFPTLPGEKHNITVKSSEDSQPLDPGQYYAIVVMDFGSDHLIQGGLPIEIPKNTEESTA